MHESPHGRPPPQPPPAGEGIEALLRDLRVNPLFIRGRNGSSGTGGLIAPNTRTDPDTAQIPFNQARLAGEHFYTELEQVRLRGSASLQALEVLYMCLLTGFQGKYMLDGKEKLNYLIASLGKEIADLKGKRAQFAPH